MKHHGVNRYLKAFTLIELVVAMLIGSVVVLIAFTSYEIISAQYLNYRKKTSVLAQATLFNTLMTRDILNSRIALLSKDSNLILRFDKLQAIEYDFTRSFIVRRAENNSPDTFLIAPNKVFTQFNGKPLAEQHPLIDELYFNAKVLDQSIFYHFTKEYGADILMDNQEAGFYFEQN